MKSWLVSVMVAILAVVFLAGCNGGGCSRKPNPADVPETSALDHIRIEIADIKIEQGHDAAVAHMKELLRDPAEGEYKNTVLNWLMDEQLGVDPVGVVQDTYLELAGADPDLAKMGFRRVMDASTSTNKAELMSWYDKMLASGFPDEGKGFVWQLKLRLIADGGSIVPIINDLEDVFELKPPAVGLNVLGQVIGTGLSLKDYAGVRQLIERLRAGENQSDDLKRILSGAEVDMLLQQGKLAQADEYLRKNAALLGDATLSGYIGKLLTSYRKGGKPELVKSVVAWLQTDGSGYPRSRDLAMVQWIEMAAKSDDDEVLIARVNEALDSGCNYGAVFPVFMGEFYKLMSTHNREAQERYIATAARFDGSSDLSEYQAGRLSMALLDGAFYMKDFKRAYEIIEKGVPGRDEKWHTEIKDKVGAHLALQEGRYEDAILLFRNHMKRVEEWENPVSNPEDGTQMIKEAVLGFNEKRIGDIYAQMGGHAEESQAAYGRARDWYEKALEILDPKSREYKMAADELAQVP